MRANIGPYRTLKPMGEGGTGRLYQGAHVTSGALAAIKVPLGTSVNQREALRRETAALRRLSQLGHRGVVRLLEYGVEDGTPWYAMEYVVGADLKRFCRALWDQAVPFSDPAVADDSEIVSHTREISGVDVLLEAAGGERASGRAPKSASARGDLWPAAANQLDRALRVAALLADALAFIHAEGVIHGDLTASNVIVREPGEEPVLIDFGTSFHMFQAGVAREMLHATSIVHATPGYVAPECIKGEPLDARADLYALGCILYELIAGIRPFPGPSGADLMKQHSSLIPRPLSDRVAGVTPELDQLVTSLLEKDPANRLGQAREVGAILRRLLKKPLAADPASPNLPLYRPRMGGRSAALEQLREYADRARAGQGGVVLLSGESGIGKTRLANELGARAALSGMHVLSTRAVQSVSGEEGPSLSARNLEPLFVVFERVVDRCLHEPEARLTPELRATLGVLSAYAPEVFAGLGLDEPPALSPELARARVLRSLGELVTHLCEEHPLLIVLDDLQWADELTLAFVSESCTTFREQKVLLLATYRSEQTTDTIVSLVELATHDICLQRLSAAAVHAMAKDLLGSSSVPEGLTEFLVQHSEGNPFFAAEYLRAALSRGHLLASPQGWIFRAEEGPTAPRSLSDLLALRIAGLSAKAVQVLQLASVMAREFDVRVLEALSDVPELTDSGGLEELVARQILEWAGPNQYRFVHDKLREAQERALSPETRRELHRKAARRLEELSLTEPNRGLDAPIGVHWSRAGEPTLALPRLEKAARAAENAWAHARAAELYALALRQVEALGPHSGTSSGKIAALSEALADALVTQARHSEARETYDRALCHVNPTDHLGLARLQRKKAASYWILHDYAAAAQCLGGAKTAIGTPDPDDREQNLEYIEIQIGHFEQLYFSRRVGPETERLLSELAPVVERHAPPERRSFYYACAASDVAARRRYAFSAEAVELSRRSLEETAQAAPLNQIATAHLMLGFALLPGSQENCREALQCLQQAEIHAVQAGDSTLLSRIMAYYALVLVRLGEPAILRTVTPRALIAAERAQLPPYAAAVLACNAWAAWRNAERIEARSLAERAKKLWASHPHAFPFQWVAHFPLLEMLASEEAFETLQETLAQLLAPNQQALPAELNHAIEAALLCCSRESARAIQEHVADVLRLARVLGYC